MADMQILSGRESNLVRRTALYGMAGLTAIVYFALVLATFAAPFAVVFFAVSHWK